MTGRELRRIRQQLRLTQAALAELVGVTANSIARQERGAMGIRESLALLLRLLAKQQTNPRPKQRNPGRGGSR